MFKGKPKIKEKVSKARQIMEDYFELPKDIVKNIPNFTILGNEQFMIENYQGITEYNENIISIETQIGEISILGCRLKVNELRPDNIVITGIIKSINFGEK